MPEPTHLTVASPEVTAAIVAAVGAVLAALVPVTYTVLRARGTQRRTPAAAQVLLPSRVRLVDRTDEVSEVLDHLRRGEFLIAIEGSIGTGKSAVAAEVAHRLADRVGGDGGHGFRQQRRFRWLAWIDAHNECPTVADIATHLSLLTGDQGLATAGADDKETVLRSFLASQPSVLVFDNVRLTASSAQGFTRFIRTLPSGSIAVVSANTPGRLNAPRILVEELQLDFMRELLMREAKRLDVPSILTADADTISEVFRLIGGNPRAIEMLVLACSRQAATLRDVLGQLGSGEGAVIDELFSAVWDSMTPEDRLVIAACAYLRGQALPEQIEAALDIGRDSLRERIERLWTDGLLTRREEHGSLYYTVPPMICGFALKRTSEATLGRFRTGVAAYLTQRYRADWEDAAGSVPHLPATRQLIEQLHDLGEHRASFELFEVSLDIFFTLGLFDDRIQLGGIAHRAAEQLHDAEKSSLALSVVSSTHSLRGEYSQAERAIELGLRIAREAGSVRETARQIRCRAYNVFRSGDAAKALTTIDGVDEQAREAGDLHNLVDIIALRSAAQWHLGQFDECRSTVDAFLHYCQVIPWERAKAYPIREKAELALMERSYRDAGLLLTEGRQIASTYRDERQLVRITLSEARLHLFNGGLLRAWRTAQTAESEARRLGLTSERAEASAVAARARTSLLVPWRWFGSTAPVHRFTPLTIGGD